ncbi:uncharacterized protein EAE97_005589 [Botrytis byssoidea]|uniref:Uncharacterized protein n=1 Tax=Botrytis byssoidea TaxID=139641 RepID=A0A9P5M015_9HELO|nr:uncharacterized protein EAE97_005589 [Botrytis byssoidea]KAF7944956.1 hypothetical protein EAE97_005589 [Botrytis byssoidea]
MIEEIKIFKDLLKKHAESGKMMFLEDASLNLTIDVIGRVAIAILYRRLAYLMYALNPWKRDHRFCSQTSYNEMTAALRRQLLWCTTELDKRYRSIKDSEIQKKDKSIVDLAFKGDLAENPSAAGIDKSFQNFAMAQIKLFIFAGHDTASAGANIADAESVIASKPQLLNQLTYTIAVIKKILRIYPTVAALRDGQSYFSLIGDNGLRFPTERTIVWGDHYATHHNPAHWPRAEEFLPERWIVTEGHELYPPKNGWRPFERGPRNCIGQEVAMTEIKLMLALTIRDFDFKDAYEEYDVMKGHPKGLTVNGQRAYMMLRGGGHPADHYPCKVSFAKQR